VVENEKRQGDNQPYGLTQYAIGDNLFPIGHPYRHTTIGSMGDLDAASLTDVRSGSPITMAPTMPSWCWPATSTWPPRAPGGKVFRRHSRRSRRQARHRRAGHPARPIRREMTDQVATTRLSRIWSGPG
jgi:hypothetical protein